VAVSSLARVKYVAPKYPRSAERRSISGWVEVVFTVALDGSVKDIDVINSQPGDTFVNAATNAVEKWRFEPVVENGETVEKRAGARMMFAVE
jgi:protein TonB